MEVTPSGGDGGVAERGLDEMDRRAAVQSVAGVSVPEPVGRDVEFDAGALCRPAHDANHAYRLQGLPASPRPKIPPPMFRVAVPGLLSVILFAALGELTVWLPKTSVVGEKAILGTPTPVPATETVCGEPGGLLVSVKTAIRVPTATDLKVMEYAQLGRPPANRGMSQSL